jgi:hypothetical protein
MTALITSILLTVDHLSFTVLLLSIRFRSNILDAADQYIELTSAQLWELVTLLQGV